MNWLKVFGILFVLCLLLGFVFADSVTQYSVEKETLSCDGFVVDVPAQITHYGSDLVVSVPAHIVAIEEVDVNLDMLGTAKLVSSEEKMVWTDKSFSSFVPVYDLMKTSYVVDVGLGSSQSCDYVEVDSKTQQEVCVNRVLVEDVFEEVEVGFKQLVSKQEVGSVLHLGVGDVVDVVLLVNLIGGVGEFKYDVVYGAYVLDPVVVVTDFNSWVQDANFMFSKFTSSNAFDQSFSRVTWDGSVDANKGELKNSFYLYDKNLVGLWHLNNSPKDDSPYNADFNAAQTNITYGTGLWGTKGTAGADDFLVVDDADQLDLNGNFTISFWARQTSYNNSNRYLVGKWNSGNNQKAYTIKEYKGTSTLELRISANGSDEITALTSDDNILTLNKWHHIVITRNNDKTRIYRDGNLLEEETQAADVFNGHAQLVVNGYSADYETYAGLPQLQLDEVILWNKTLSVTDVNNLYNYQVLDRNLIAYWSLTDNNGTHVLNRAPKTQGIVQYDANLNNGVDTNVMGLWDKNAMRFDGVNDYLDAQTTEKLNLDFNRGDLTITAWVKPMSVESSNSNLGIITKDNNITTDGTIFEFYVQYNKNANDWRLVVAQSDSNLNNSQTTNYGSIKSNVWQYVALTVDRPSETYTFYINGKSAGTGTITKPSAYSNLPIKIGKTYNNDLWLYGGGMQELKIYDRVLNAGEILADYNAWVSNAYYDSNVLDVNIEQKPTSVRFNNQLGSFGKELQNDDPIFYDKNLVGLWHFNDNNTDSSMYARDWNIELSYVAYTTGLWNTNALLTNRYLTINDEGNPRLDLNAYWTISSWIKLTSVPTAIMSINSKYAHSDDFNSQRSFWTYVDIGVKRPSVVISADGTSVTTVTVDNNVFIVNQWHHLVIVKNLTILKIYVDGQLVKKQIVPDTCLNSDAPFSINSRANNYTATILPGYNQEEVAVFDKALTDANVIMLYNKYASKLGVQYRTALDRNSLSTATWSDTNFDANVNIPITSNNTYAQTRTVFQSYMFPTTDFKYNATPVLSDLRINFEQEGEAPTTTVTYSTTWVSTDQNVTFTCRDQQNSCKLFYYRLDTNLGIGINWGGWQVANWGSGGTNPFGLDTIDGNIGIQFVSTDMGDNNETTRTIFALKDQTAQTVSITNPTAYIIEYDTNVTLAFDVNFFPSPYSQATVQIIQNLPTGVYANATCTSTGEFTATCSNDVILIGEGTLRSSNTLAIQTTDASGTVLNSTRIIYCQLGLDPKYHDALNTTIYITVLIFVVFGAIFILTKEDLLDEKLLIILLALFVAALVATVVTLL